MESITPRASQIGRAPDKVLCVRIWIELSKASESHLPLPVSEKKTKTKITDNKYRPIVKRSAQIIVGPQDVEIGRGICFVWSPPLGHQP
jgi:hypothetical protein